MQMGGAWFESDDVFEKQVISTDKAPKAIGPYSQAVRAGNLIFVSGQIPIVPDTGELLQGDISAQTRRVLQNVEAILDAAGSSMERVVKVTVFLADMANYPAMNEVYAEFFRSECPARAAVDEYRHTLGRILRLLRSRVLREFAGEVLSALAEALGPAKVLVEMLVDLLRKTERSFQAQLRQLEETDYQHRGPGIALPWPFHRSEGEMKALLERAEREVLPEIRGALRGLCRTASEGIEAGQLASVLSQYCERFLEDAGVLSSNCSVASELVKNPEAPASLERAFRLATETSAADELADQTGKHLTLVGVEGGEHSVLRDTILGVARNIGDLGQIVLVDTEDPAEIIVIRLEVGVPVTAFKCLQAWEKEYEELEVDERCARHLEPLYGLYPSLFEGGRLRRKREYVLYGLAVGAIREYGGALSYSPLTGERVVDSSWEKLGETVARSYRLSVDATSRFIHRIKCDGFATVEDDVRQASERLAGGQWSTSLKKVLAELATLRRLYHQDRT